MSSPLLQKRKATHWCFSGNSSA